MYAWTKLNRSTPVGPLTTASNETVSYPKEMAGRLQQQYKNVFSTPQLSKTEAVPISLQVPTDEDHQLLTNIKLEIRDIVASINNIKPDSVAGPDGLHARLLRNCRSELAKPLQQLWCKSLSEGEELKPGTVTPIHKGCSRGQARNYHPVVLTSHFIKIIGSSDNSLLNT